MGLYETTPLSVKYVIDGYNLLFRTNTQERPLEQTREELLLHLNTLAQYLSLDIVLIFDAQHTQESLQRHHYHFLEILFTDPQQTADDFIIGYTSSLKRTKRSALTIVSSDSHVRHSVEREHISVLTVHQFFSLVRNKLAVQQQKKNEEKPSITLSSQDIKNWEKLFEKR